MKTTLLFLCVILSGCSGIQALGDNQSRQTAQQGPATVAIPVLPPTDSKAAAGPVQRVEASASNNATEQTQQLGIQIAKLGERVEGIHAELNSTINANATLSASAVADIRASIRTEIDATAKVNAKAVAELDVKLEALAAAQVGINNRIDQTTQTISAGRDANTKTIQFTKDMSDTLIESERSHGRTLIAVVLLLCGVLVVFLECSRRRAEKRAVKSYSGGVIQ